MYTSYTQSAWKIWIFNLFVCVLRISHLDAFSVTLHFSFLYIQYLTFPSKAGAASSYFIVCSFGFYILLLFLCTVINPMPELDVVVYVSFSYYTGVGN